MYNLRGQGSYAVSGSFTCADCGALLGPNIAIILVISIVSLLFITFSVRSTLKGNEEVEKVQKADYEASFLKIIIEKFIKTDQAALFIKIFTNYAQIASTITTFNLSIPSETAAVIDSVGAPIKKAIFSMDCFLVSLAGR